MYSHILSVLTLILLIITAGCGLTIHFGGESFKNAITGHMFLGVTTLILALATTISFLFCELAVCHLRKTGLALATGKRSRR